MKLIAPSVQLFQQEPGIEGIYKQIERVGRTCYKSEDKITNSSAKPFVDKLISSKHYAMLEHATVYLQVLVSTNVQHSFDTKNYHNDVMEVYIDNQFSRVKIKPLEERDYIANITTNYRVLVENNWLDDLQYLSSPTEFHPKRITLKFNTNIGVSREGNRHRTFSIAEQSTRYCNYSKEKFGNELTFIDPCWDADNAIFLDTLEGIEKNYMLLLKQGWKPQQAREILPLATATEVVYTAFEDDWRHFFDLRLRGTTGAPHPNMKQIAELAHQKILDELHIVL